MLIEDIKIRMKVTPFQKTVDGYEKSIEEYKSCTSYGWGNFLKENGYLYVTGYDEYENAWTLGDITCNDNEDGDYFNSEDFEPYKEIQMNSEEINKYLDNVITLWRKRKEEYKDEDEIFMSRCYIDAYQSVRISLFGELLP